MMKRKKIAIVGPYDEPGCGQTVKTISMYATIEKEFLDCDIVKVNTSFWRKRAVSCFYTILRSILCCDVAIVLLADNGITYFARYILPMLKLCKKSVFYIVIGGWLPKLLCEKKDLVDKLRRFDVIFAETKGMQSMLTQMGIVNVEYMPNYKTLNILDNNLTTKQQLYPIRLCTFSRVMREKGIEDAVQVIKSINNKNNRAVFTLDIFGAIEETQRDWFDALKKTFSKEISYRGVVQYNRSVEVLRNFDALLFPTKFFTEGIPGTIIDAYAAGLPVIASRWVNFDEVIDEGKTGLGYLFGSIVELEKTLEVLVKNPYLLDSCKPYCLKAAHNYTEKNATKVLKERIRAVLQ